MAAKERNVEITEDLGPDPEEPKGFAIGLATIIVGVLLAILSILFFYLLGTKTDLKFGIAQIIYSIALGLLAVFFLYWLTLLMKKNAYLGLITGIAAIIASIYAIFVKYSGPYTTTFAIITGVILIIYLFIHFFKAKKS